MKEIGPKDALADGTAQVLKGVGFKDEEARIAYESWAAVKTVERVQVRGNSLLSFEALTLCYTVMIYSGTRVCFNEAHLTVIIVHDPCP